MALESPALTLANEVLFGDIKPVLDAFIKIGPVDFTAGKPEIAAKPGTTVKVPWSSVSAASTFDATSNNYLTGGNTDWVSLTAAHYLQGFDISGVNVDQGVDAAKMKNLFTRRASKGIALSMQNAMNTALHGTTTSTVVTIPAVGTATLADYMKLAADVSWLDRSTSILAVNGAEFGNIKALYAANHIVGTATELAQYLGFKDLVLIPGMVERICIIPNGTMGFMGRVPAIIANYMESGVETEPETGLSIGIVIASDQAKNRLVANADMWFGVVACSASANASTTKGIINVGTTAG